MWPGLASMHLFGMERVSGRFLSRVEPISGLLFVVVSAAAVAVVVSILFFICFVMRSFSFFFRAIKTESKKPFQYFNAQESHVQLVVEKLAFLFQIIFSSHLQVLQFRNDSVERYERVSAKLDK